MQRVFTEFGRRTLWAAGGTLTAILVLHAAMSCHAADETPARGAIDFARQIQPILAKHCFQCHGPNDDKGGLRLNSRAGALAELESGSHAVVPKQPLESELLRRVESTDPDERMPPEGKPLTAEQIGLLRAWIVEGVPWQQAWAFWRKSLAYGVRGAHLSELIRLLPCALARLMPRMNPFDGADGAAKRAPVDH